MSKANQKPVAIEVTAPSVPPTATAPETSSPETTQPTPTETATENKTENKPATAQAPKHQTSMKLAIRKERQGQ